MSHQLNLNFLSLFYMYETISFSKKDLNASFVSKEGIKVICKYVIIIPVRNASAYLLYNTKFSMYKKFFQTSSFTNKKCRNRQKSDMKNSSARFRLNGKSEKRRRQTDTGKNWPEASIIASAKCYAVTSQTRLQIRRRR